MRTLKGNLRGAFRVPSQIAFRLASPYLTYLVTFPSPDRERDESSQ